MASDRDSGVIFSIKCLLSNLFRWMNLFGWLLFHIGKLGNLVPNFAPKVQPPNQVVEV